jgi:hypothetical protein
MCPDTAFDELADTRINKELSGFSSIKSKEEYFDKLEAYFGGSKAGLGLLNARKRSWDDIREEMFSGSSAKDVVEKNSIEEVVNESRALRRAQRFESRRPKVGRVRDESRTSRRVRGVTLSSVRRWERGGYRRYDLRGIDTRRSQGLRVSGSVVTRADVRLKNFSVSVDVRGVKHYHDRSGRFVGSPFVARRRKR